MEFVVGGGHDLLEIADPLTAIMIGLIVANLVFRTIERNIVQKWGTQS